MSTCNICEARHMAPVYVSPENVSITSLTEIRSGRTEVFACAQCGHLQTTPLPDLDAYYDEQYRILIDSEDEDQLYKIVDGEKIFRVRHQVDTLLEKIELPTGASVLDFGCAKGASARRLARCRPDLKLHLFDISRMYLPFWQKFSEPDRWGTHDVPAHWHGKFDAVFSMYVAEHVAAPVAFARQIASLLKPGGTLYWLIPDVAANPADFIVADHVNHFSEHSLAALMEKAGLNLRTIDSRSHEAGLIAIADTRTTKSNFRPSSSLARWQSDVRGIASLWSGLGSRIRQFETQRPANEPSAIYGSGFYGTYIASCLSSLDNVRCFVDRNPFRQGHSLLGKPIIDPCELEESIQTVYVGLNPLTARQNIGDVDAWHDRDLSLCFLNDDDSAIRSAA